MLINAMWYGGIALKALATYRMAKNGLLRRFPLLWSYLAICVASSILLAVLRPYRKTYGIFYAATLPLSLLAEFGAVVGLYWALTANLGKFRTVGTWVLGILGCVGTAAAWLTIYLPLPSPPATIAWLWDTGLLVQRYASVAMFVVLVGALVLLPRGKRFPRPATATSAALILIADVSMGSLIAMMTRGLGHGYPTFIAAASVAPGLALGSLWAFALKPLPEPEPHPLTKEEFQAIARKAAMESHLASAEVREALRAFE